MQETIECAILLGGALATALTFLYINMKVPAYASVRLTTFLLTLGSMVLAVWALGSLAGSVV